MESKKRKAETLEKKTATKKPAVEEPTAILLPQLGTGTECVVEFPFKAISHNMYYRIFRSRYVISPAGQMFRFQVAQHLLQVPQVVKVLGPVQVHIVFQFKDRRARDLDNLCKAILDTVKHVLFEDDSCIQYFSARKTIGDKDNTVVRVSQIQ